MVDCHEYRLEMMAAFQPSFMVEKWLQKLQQELNENITLKIIEEKLWNRTVSLPHLLNLFSVALFMLLRVVPTYYPQGLFIEMYNKRVKYNIGRMITQSESRIQRPSRASWSVDPRLFRNQIFLFIYFCWRRSHSPSIFSPASSFFSIFTKNWTPSITICINWTSENPSLSALEMSKT